MTEERRDPKGKRALFSGGETDVIPAVPTAEGKRALYSEAQRRGLAIAMRCSACGTRSTLTPVQFLAQHFPAWLWLPWRRHSHLMRCPSCGRFAWQSVSLA